MERGMKILIRDGKETGMSILGGYTSESSGIGRGHYDMLMIATADMTRTKKVTRMVVTLSFYSFRREAQVLHSDFIVKMDLRGN
jgi:hypothetical protein